MKMKNNVDFLITGIGYRTIIEFSRPVELKENRSIERMACNGHVYRVTDAALKKLKQQYSWSCDF